MTALAAALAAAVVLTACGGGDKAAAPRAPSASPAVSVSASTAPAPTKRHRDDKVGLEYGVPNGWHGPYTEDLVFLTSLVQSVPMEEGGGDPETFGMVGAGRFEETFYDPGKTGLGSAAMSTAIGFAEFFVPVSGKRTILVDEATRVDDRDGWRVRFRVTPDDPSEGDPALVEIVAVGGRGPAYVLGFVSGDDPALEATVAAALADVRLA